jgi:selenocysteine lyase/cysteine desulfurase
MNDRVSRRDFLGVLGTGSLLPAMAAGQTFASVDVPAVSRDLWAWLRAQLVLEPGLGWLDTAAFGPALRAVMAQGFRTRERQSEDFAGYQAAASSPDAVRRRLADLAGFLGAGADDLAFTSGAGEGLNVVAHGLDLQPGDEVITTSHDRAAAVYPWLLEAKRRGIRVVQVPQAGVPASPDVVIGRFVTAFSPRTKVLAFAHVQATDGTVMPVRELCALARDKGVFTVVDGAIAPGMLDFRIADLGCDAYAASCHHWMNAPYGTGVLFLKREARARVWPLAVDEPSGWESHDRSGVPLPASGVPETQAKYGALSRCRAPDLQGIGLAIELQQAVNRSRITSRILELASFARQQLATLSGLEVLTPAHPALSAGIVSVRLAGRDHAALVKSLADEDRVVVGHVAQGAGFEAIRISLHASNDYDEIDRCVNSLRRRI